VIARPGLPDRATFVDDGTPGDAADRGPRRRHRPCSTTNHRISAKS
jgi:hypothetical protein